MAKAQAISDLQYVLTTSLQYRIVSGICSFAALSKHQPVDAPSSTYGLMKQVSMQVWPICGDGLTLQITHAKAGQSMPETLMSRRIGTDSKDKPQRQKVIVKQSSRSRAFPSSPLSCRHKGARRVRLTPTSLSSQIRGTDPSSQGTILAYSSETHLWA